MPIFTGGPSKQMIKYDGTSLDLSGLNIPALTAGSGSLSFGLGYLQIKRELVQAAAEIAQLLDAAQFANCTKMNMIPKDSPERIKLIDQAIESEAQLVKFSLVMKLVAANLTSQIIQKALADWIASQFFHTQELSSQAKDVPVTRGGEPEVPIPSLQKVESSIENAKEAEPYLENAIQRGGASFDLNKVIDDLK
jgi:hypothetical protein